MDALAHDNLVGIRRTAVDENSPSGGTILPEHVAVEKIQGDAGCAQLRVGRNFVEQPEIGIRGVGPSSSRGQ